MDLEKLATSAVIIALSKTERLSSFINSGDKEPCWDGNIYIHEDKTHTKKNIKKVATQVKGKAVKALPNKNTVKYPISYDDLNAYMMNGGTLFFVVYLDSVTGDALQIYYTSLLPFKIKTLLKNKKSKYQVVLQKFPEDNFQKTELLLNFHSNAQRQASFAGKDLPSIDDLKKQGVLESLSFHYIGVGENLSDSSLPKKLDGKSLTVYANIKGGSAPIPVEYYESIHQITMQNGKDEPVCVNGKKYYDGLKVITTAETIELKIGSCVRIIMPNIDKAEEKISLSVKINIKGTLKEQILGMEFVVAMIEHASLSIGDMDFPVKFTDEQMEAIKSKEYPVNLGGYKKAQKLLEVMNVKKDLKIQECTEEDLKNLNLLIGAISENLPVKDLPENNKAQCQKLTIANINLAVVYLKRETGGYNMFDYFGNRFAVCWQPTEETEPVRISQFSSMRAEDFLSLDNLNLSVIVKDYESIETSDLLIELGNNTLLELLKAYDIRQEPDFLKTAKGLLNWLKSHPDYISDEVITLNDLQIALRERALTFGEKSKLHTIIANTTDEFFKLGALLLLDEQSEAESIIDDLPEEELERFKLFPIYRFYKNSKEQ